LPRWPAPPPVSFVAEKRTLVPTTQALRALRAEQIIRDAYGIDRRSPRRTPVRYELLGADVAIAIVRDERAAPRTVVKVARRRPDGRAMQMRKACRNGFRNIREQIAYFETMYALYGTPR
jgi:hypothetical protein